MSKVFGYALICVGAAGAFVGAMYLRDGAAWRGALDIAVAIGVVAWGVSHVEGDQ